MRRAGGAWPAGVARLQLAFCAVRWTAPLLLGLSGLGAAAWLGLERPRGLGLGVGGAQILGALTLRLLVPLAALLLLLLGTPTVLDAVGRRRRDGSASLGPRPTPAARRGHELLAGLAILLVLAAAFAVPFAWPALLGATPAGLGGRLLLGLGGAVLLGVGSSTVALLGAPSFGSSLLRAYTLQASVLTVAWLAGWR